MKKNLFLVLSIALVFGVNAQNQRRSGDSSFDGSKFFSTEKPDKPLTIGVRGGLNIASISGINDLRPESSEVDYDNWTEKFSGKSSLTGNAGIIIDYGFIKSLHVQTGLFYVLRAGKMIDNFEYRNRSYENEFSAKIGYLKVPVLISYRLPLSNALEFQVNAGPYFAFALHGKFAQKYDAGFNEEALYDGFNLFNDYWEHPWVKEYPDEYPDGIAKSKSAVNRFDLGLEFGAGVTFNNHYYLGISYDLGLSKLNNDMADEIINDNQDSKKHDFKNRAFCINIGYNF